MKSYFRETFCAACIRLLDYSFHLSEGLSRLIALRLVFAVFEPGKPGPRTFKCLFLNK